MPQKMKGFTLDQHEQLGLELQTIYDRFVVIKTNLNNTYGKDDDATVFANKIFNNLIELKGVLDKTVGNEQSTNKEIDTHKIYFQALREDHIRYPQPIRPVPQDSQ